MKKIQLVSVIITCHNLEKYIGSAIESVLNQDFTGKVEIVVIDDCSTDRSSEIIKTFNNIRYLCLENNVGVLMATIIGLENTTGELIFFLDGDDIWELNKLSKIVDYFQDNPCLAFVTHDLSYIDSNGAFLNRKSRPFETISTVNSSNKCAVIRNGILLHGDYVWLGSAYAVHRTLGKVNEFCVYARSLRDSFNTYQDWPLAFWIACQADIDLGYIPLKLFRYRLHGSNYSGDTSSVEKAIRNIRRTRNTMLAMSDIAVRFNADAHVRDVTYRKLRFYCYLDDLYSGNNGSATIGLLASIPYLITSTSTFLKEVARFLGVQLLGVERFIFFSQYKRRYLDRQAQQ